MRDLTTDMVTGLTAAVAYPALLADMEFDSGTLYMWTGVGTLTWNGNDYIGGGNLVDIAATEETQELEAKGLTCTLTGVPTDLISLALSERTRGRPFRLYLALIASPGVVVSDPYRRFTGLMDVMEVKDTGTTSTITLSVENQLIRGQRAKESRYTAEDQKKKYPDDRGFEFIPPLQDKEVQW